ncbi:Alternative oxidase 4 [Monoraphidium neglectum]|uniref:Ubiquinol oxidase n=1 Tax=Monoraphidium neglectum TaxID=145388 RepID=A0A0D2LN89_9CHLO|nr:Alternative oxidase 4 [Monoraphidium neglectum]KIZ07729.1 Alternative oxidase 4 [Monoraphidium neglectum]|eukprot:XP_013906748.1 Alternative oxidase 4 [Monoraphidium neglectum]
MAAGQPSHTNVAALQCTICLDEGLVEVGELDSCDHRFCPPCITRWAETDTHCPACRVRFRVITRKQLRLHGECPSQGKLPGEVLSVVHVEERNQVVGLSYPQDASLLAFLATVHCQLCGADDNDEQLLLCDGCDRGYHTFCLGLHEIPTGEWFCTECTRARARARGRDVRAVASRRQGGQQPHQRRVRRRRVIPSESASEDFDVVVVSSGEEGRAARPAGRRRAVRSRRAASNDDGDYVGTQEDEGEDVRSDDDEEDREAESGSSSASGSEVDITSSDDAEDEEAAGGSDELRAAKEAAVVVAKRQLRLAQQARAVAGGAAALAVAVDRDAVRSVTHAVYERVKAGAMPLAAVMEAAASGSAEGLAAQAVAAARAEAERLLAGSGESLEEDYNCPVFIDRDGNMVEIMCCDYGFRSGAQRVYSDIGARIPAPTWRLALNNLAQEWRALRRSFRYNDYGKISAKNPAQGPVSKVFYGLGSGVVSAFSAIDAWLEDSRVFSRLLPEEIPKEVFDPLSGGLSAQCREVRAKLQQLTLSNAKVWEREHKREAEGGGIETPWVVKAVYLALCVFLDVAYDKRPIQRFWFLETVARMPYFSYLTMLHLLETLGWWRAGAELRKVHFAEEWNELHHLQIMEALGGDQLWIDRFMAQLAYNFSELIEAHAVDTYSEFADANEELLKSLPPPLVAAEYYTGPDLYLFDSFQTSQATVEQPRRPSVNTLHDVFLNIAADEGEHVKTMRACQDYSVAGDLEALKEKQAEEAMAGWDAPDVVDDNAPVKGASGRAPTTQR